MMDNYDKKYWSDNQCPPISCKKKTCKCGLEKIVLPASLGDDSKDSPIAPKNGAYCDAIVVYEANRHIYIYSKEGVPTLMTSGGGGDYDEIIKEIQDELAETENNLAQEILDREGADNTLQEEIDAIKNSPDVVDIVATYAALQAYDTSKLGDNDIIRVLADETHDGDSTYYRWDKHNSTWTYIGAVSLTANTIFYANVSESGNTRHIYKNSDMTGTVSVQDILDANEEGQVVLRMSTALTPENFNDAYLQNTYVGVSDYQFLFLDNRHYYEYDATTTADTTYYYSKSTIQLEMSAGTNITITGNTISATDTTYNNFIGTDGADAGTSGLVPAPATTDIDKFLKSDGTWAIAGGGPTVVQTTGTSTTDVMSQNAITKMVYPMIATLPDAINIRGTSGIDTATGDSGIAVGVSTFARGERSVSIGTSATAYAAGDRSVAIGNFAKVNNNSKGIAIGNSATCSNPYSIALGSSATTSRVGELNIGAGTSGEGYNSTNYRVIGGVHDGQLAQDAVTVNQVNSVIDAINTALNTSIPHIGA